MATKPTAAERFAVKVNYNGPISLVRGVEGRCWTWRAYTEPDGYGRFHPTRTTNARAHKWAYEQARGPVPAGLELDHRCRRRNCVRPDHLEAVTHAENNARSTSPTAVNARKTTCAAGHDITDPANVYLRPAGGRTCRICKRARGRSYDAAKRAAKAPVITLPTAPNTPERQAA